MSDFLPPVQVVTSTGASGSTASIAMGTSTAGSIMIVMFGAGQGAVTAATACTDDNGNAYELVCRNLHFENSCVTQLWVCYKIAVTPHNPLTITLSGIGGYSIGSPSIIAVEITPTANWQFYTNTATQQTASLFNVSSVSIYAGQLSGPTIGAVTGTVGQVLGNGVALLLFNEFSDGLLIFGDYQANGTLGPPWTTSGTVLGSTTELDGSSNPVRAAVLCYQDVDVSTLFCGSLPLSIICGNPPPYQIAVPYSWQPVVRGGVAPYSFAVTGGSLPPGLSLNLTTGFVTGTPTSPGSYSFTITVTDSASATASVTCVIPNIAGNMIVQSVKLTDVNRMKLWRITCCAGATIGDWKTGFKFFNGS